MGYHLFSLRTGKNEWWKTTRIFLDREFYEAVDLVEGYVPFNMSVYHFDDAATLHQNRVIERRPILELPVPTLFSSVPG